MLWVETPDGGDTMYRVCYWEPLFFCFFSFKGERGMCPQIRFGDSFRVGKGEDSRVLLVRQENHLNFIQVCSRGILACDVGM